MKRLAILTPVLALSLTTVAHAGALAPTKPSQVVMLTSDGTTASCPSGGAATRAINTIVMRDATTASFAIPTGQVLVVTGVDWAHAWPGNIGNSIQVTLRLGTGATRVWEDVAQVEANPSGGERLS